MGSDSSVIPVPISLLNKKNVCCVQTGIKISFIRDLLIKELISMKIKFAMDRKEVSYIIVNFLHKLKILQRNFKLSILYQEFNTLHKLMNRYRYDKKSIYSKNWLLCINLWIIICTLNYPTCSMILYFYPFISISVQKMQKPCKNLFSCHI